MIFGKTNPCLYKQIASAPANFTTNSAVDSSLIISSGHGLSIGDIVVFSSTGTLPSGLIAGYYYVVNDVISPSAFTITAEGTNTISFTNDGSGTHSFTPYKIRVELSNFLITRDEPQEEGFFHESVINGHREWVSKGMHWELEIRSNIFKEGSEAAVRAKFKEIHSCLYQPVWVYKHFDGLNLFRDSNGKPVSFIMDIFQPAFVTQVNFEDYLILGLKSTEYVDLNAML